MNGHRRPHPHPHPDPGPGPSPEVAIAHRRLAADLAAAGRRYPAVAAAALVCRGLLGIDRGALARALGIAPRFLASIEAGIAPGWTVPRRLTSLAPDLDWAAAGVEAATPADRARRHPAAHRPGPARRPDEPP